MRPPLILLAGSLLLAGGLAPALAAQAEKSGRAEAGKAQAGKAQSRKAQPRPANKAPGRPKARAVRAARLLGAPKRKPLSQDDYRTRLQKKLAEPWVKNAAWVMDFDSARAQAKQTGKLVLGYFTRSYAP